MTDYRVIIAGSRSFNDYELLRELCLSILQEKMRTHRVVIVSGHARGADSLGEIFAKEFSLPFELHPAKWRLLGKAASMVRNAEMAKCSDALIAFWDGESSGTRHMINFARKRGLDTCLVQRLIATTCDIPLQKIINTQLYPNDWNNLDSKINELIGAPFYIEDTPWLGTKELLESCRHAV